MIYFLRNQKGHIKIGCTINPLTRFKEHVGMHGVLEIVGAMEGGKDTEWQLHRAFKDDKVKRKYSTALEWFYPVDDLMRYIADNADLLIPDEWRIVLQTAIERVKQPYANGDLFTRLVKRLSQEDKWMSIQSAAQLSGIPSTIINALLNNRVRRITAPSLPHYQRLADWLGCRVDELTDWQPRKTTCARCDKPRHVTRSGKMLGYCREHWNQITSAAQKRRYHEKKNLLVYEPDEPERETA